MCLHLFSHGIALRMSCPHISQQNGKAERIIRSTNDILRSLLFQASMPPFYWVEALHTAIYLLNLHPTKSLNFGIPYQSLFGSLPDYSHLQGFGYRCYPNLSATTTHKLASRSKPCVFLGYLDHHKGYFCLDLSTNRIIISRHVTFDEASFPFPKQPNPLVSSDFDFLSIITHAPAPVPTPISCPPAIATVASPLLPPAATPLHHAPAPPPSFSTR